MAAAAAATTAAVCVGGSAPAAGRCWLDCGSWVELPPVVPVHAAREPCAAVYAREGSAMDRVVLRVSGRLRGREGRERGASKPDERGTERNQLSGRLTGALISAPPRHRRESLSLSTARKT